MRKFLRSLISGKKFARICMFLFASSANLLNAATTADGPTSPMPGDSIAQEVNVNSGPTTGGNTVTITGTGFSSSNTIVFFGDTPGTNVVVLSDTMLTVTVPPGDQGTVEVTVSTPFGVTPVISAGEYTYLSLTPLPPSNFNGVIKKDIFLNLPRLVLKATWDAAPSPDVVAYRIYDNQTLVEEITADSPLIFIDCLHSSKQVLHYQLVAVDSAGVESTPVRIRLISG